MRCIGFLMRSASDRLDRSSSLRLRWRFRPMTRLSSLKIDSAMLSQTSDAEMQFSAQLEIDRRAVAIDGSATRDPQSKRITALKLDVNAEGSAEPEAEGATASTGAAADAPPLVARYARPGRSQPHRRGGRSRHTVEACTVRQRSGDRSSQSTARTISKARSISSHRSRPARIRSGSRSWKSGRAGRNMSFMVRSAHDPSPATNHLRIASSWQATVRRHRPPGRPSRRWNSPQCFPALTIRPPIVLSCRRRTFAPAAAR